MARQHVLRLRKDDTEYDPDFDTIKFRIKYAHKHVHVDAVTVRNEYAHFNPVAVAEFDREFFSHKYCDNGDEKPLEMY